MENIIRLFNKYFLLLIIAYFTGLLLFFKNDYFFGDAISSTSRIANFIFDTGTYAYPEGFDPGHPPTYSILLTFFWKLFGKSLWISHIYGMLWCVFILIIYRKLCGMLLDEFATNLATLILMVQPTFVSQNAMMLNTAMLMGVFLWAVFYLWSGQMFKYLLVLCLMVLTHLQGAFFLAALAAADYMYHKKELKLVQFLIERFIIYLIPFLLFVGWLIVHYQHSGWFLISPDYTDTHSTKSWLQLVKGLAYCWWRFLDYGMAVPFVIYVYLKLKNHSWNKDDVTLWSIFLVTSIIMSYILKNTIAHRYFLGIQMFFLILAVKEIIHGSKRPFLHFTLVFFALLIGNFVYYPGKTIADANIQYRSFFSSFDHMIIENKDAIMYSKAPIANETKYFDPNAGKDSKLPLKDLLRINYSIIDTLPVVVYSNVCAEFNKEETEKLKGWYGKSYEDGAVFINVYLNPLYHQKPDGWELRKPGAFEEWMTRMKQKLK